MTNNEFHSLVDVTLVSLCCGTESNEVNTFDLPTDKMHGTGICPTCGSKTFFMESYLWDELYSDRGDE